SPAAALVQSSDGLLYGTAPRGGSHGGGIAFRLRPDGSAYTILHNFGSIPGDGISPTAALLEGRDGALYGTTSGGGGGDPQDNGTVFKLSKDGSGYRVLHNFSYEVLSASVPLAPLIQGSDGALYGTTS